MEHTTPLTLSLTLKQAHGSTLLAIGDGDAETHISMPSAWRRREVWGAPIASVTAEGEGFGFTRWHLPPHARLAFFAPVTPASLLIHNPSPTLLTLHLTILDLASKSATTRTVLVKDVPTKIW